MFGRDRMKYLRGLSEDYGVPINIVVQLATALGEEEDFDALITELSDLSDQNIENDEYNGEEDYKDSEF